MNHACRDLAASLTVLGKQESVGRHSTKCLPHTTRRPHSTQLQKLLKRPTNYLAAGLHLQPPEKLTKIFIRQTK